MKKSENKKTKIDAPKELDRDEIQKNARHGAEYWYADIWKTVDKCVFCDLKERYIIKEYDSMVLTTNIYPYIDGHLMIIPKRHVTHLKELTQEEWNAVNTLSYTAKKMLKQLFGIKSIWLLYREGPLGEATEKTVDHLHIHIIPYQKGLVEWHYQKIEHSPAQVATAFKNNMDTIDSLIKRFNKKYQNA